MFLFLFLPLAGEGTSDRGLSVRVDSEWEIDMDMESFMGTNHVGIREPWLLIRIKDLFEKERKFSR